MQFPPAKVLIYQGIWNVMSCQREEKASSVVRNFHTAIIGVAQGSWKMSQKASGKATLPKTAHPTRPVCQEHIYFTRWRSWTESSAALNTFLPSRNGLAEHCNQKITWMKKNHDLKCFAVRGKVISDTGLQNRRCQQAGEIGFLERLPMGSKVG